MLYVNIMKNLFQGRINKTVNIPPPVQKKKKKKKKLAFQAKKGNKK